MTRVFGVIRMTSFLGAALFCFGCATTNTGTKDTPTAESGAPLTQTEEGVVLSRIVEPSIPKGKCGMVLWTAEGKRAMPVFRFIAEEKADISVNNQALKLNRVTFTGASGFGVFENQSFTNEEGLTAKVDAFFGLGFDGGAYLERGLITIETPDGWRTVVPTAGIAGCRG